MAYFFSMASVGSRIQRLQRLRGLLASGDGVTIAELAGRLEISPRTLMRDLDVLRDDGVLIEADRGRGGGVRLARNFPAGRVQFNAPEAMGVLVSLAIAEKLQTPLLDTHVRAVRQKIAATFTFGDRDRVAALRRRILIGAPASMRVLSSYGPLRTNIAPARQAFFNQRLLDIRYQDEHGAETTRTIEPQYLYLNPPAWYFLAWDLLRDGVRIFRIDRVVQVQAQANSFRLRPTGPFLQAVESGAETL